MELPAPEEAPDEPTDELTEVVAPADECECNSFGRGPAPDGENDSVGVCEVGGCTQ